MVPQPGPGEATTTLLPTAYTALSTAIYRHVAQAAGAVLLNLPSFLPVGS